MDANIQQPQTQDGGPASGVEGEAKRLQEERLRRDVILSTVLDTAARERLSRIALVSPQRSQKVEETLMRMVQTGQIRERVTEEQFINLLDQMEAAHDNMKSKKPTIVYQRRKVLDDDFDI